MASLGDGNDEILVETYLERLIGLAEMFPNPVRNAACKGASMTRTGVEKLWDFSKTATWIVLSSGIILMMPANILSERQDLIDSQKAQEKSILLGPNAAMTGQNMTPAVPMPLVPGNLTPK